MPTARWYTSGRRVNDGPRSEWCLKQGECNRGIYEWIQATRPEDAHDWKVDVLFYSGLHRINYGPVVPTGRAPENHSEGSRQVERRLPQAYKECKRLYVMSIRARHREGYRHNDGRRRAAGGKPRRIEGELPFPQPLPAGPAWRPCGGAAALRRLASGAAPGRHPRQMPLSASAAGAKPSGPRTRQGRPNAAARARTSRRARLGGICECLCAGCRPERLDRRP